MERWPDNPIIRNCERTGWPDGKEPEIVCCPICHEENPEYFYFDGCGMTWVDIIGCSFCIDKADALEWYLENKEEI